MQREHEEAMRADYARYAGLVRKMLRPSVNEHEIQLLDLQQQLVADRWEAGPHAEHWDYLDAAFHDWRSAPETMCRFVSSDGSGMTDVQRRSQEQARILAHFDRPRPRVERQR